MPDVHRLPGPNADLWDWQMHGRCREADPAMFFPPDNERGRRRRQREAQAKAICRHCAVMAQCLSHALAVGEPFGVWGGMSESDRRALLVPTRNDVG